MKISDLLITIENIRGSYKKFRQPYPLPGATYPTHYGFITGYKSEDGKDLDVFLGSGSLNGWITMLRPDFPDGFETKTFMQVSAKELAAIKKEFKPVILDHKKLDERAFTNFIKKFKG